MKPLDPRRRLVAALLSPTALGLGILALAYWAPGRTGSPHAEPWLALAALACAVPAALVPGRRGSLTARVPATGASGGLGLGLATIGLPPLLTVVGPLSAAVVGGLAVLVAGLARRGTPGGGPASASRLAEKAAAVAAATLAAGAVWLARTGTPLADGLPAVAGEDPSAALPTSLLSAELWRPGLLAAGAFTALFAALALGAATLRDEIDPAAARAWTVSAAWALAGWVVGVALVPASLAGGWWSIAPALAAIALLSAEVDRQARRGDRLDGERGAAETAAAEATARDAVTGLPLRSLCLERLRDAYERGRDAGGRLALALIEIDRFRDLNLQWGYPTGDRILAGVAEALTADPPFGAEAFRLDGGGFALLAEGPTGSEAFERIDRLRRDLPAPPRDSRRDPRPGSTAAGLAGGRLTASAGVVGFPEVWAASGDELLLLAERALLEARLRGGDQALLDLGRGRYRTGDGRILSSGDAADGAAPPRIFA